MNELIQFWSYSGTDETVRLMKEVRDGVPNGRAVISSKYIVETFGNNVIIPRANFEYIASLTNYNIYHKFCLDLKKNLAVNFGFDFDNWKGVPKKLKKFIESPNANIMDSFTEIFDKTMYDFMVFNRMTNEIARAGDTTAIYHVNVKNMYLKVSNDLRRITEYVQLFYGMEQVVASFPVYSPSSRGSSMLAYESYDPSSDFYGIPYYLPAVSAIIGNDTIEKYINSFFENNARPDFMVIITGQPMTPEQKTALSSQLLSLKGVGNGHKALYMNFDNPAVKVEIREMSKIVDENFRNTKRDYRDDMATIHGVPPKVLGFSGGGTGMGAGSESIGALKILVDIILPPVQQKFANIYNMFFLHEFGFNPKMYFKKANVYSDKDLCVISDLLKRSGIITTNEARKMNDYQEVEGDMYNLLASVDSSSVNLDIEQDSIFTTDPDKDAVFSSQSNKPINKMED